MHFWMILLMVAIFSKMLPVGHWWFWLILGVAAVATAHRLKSSPQGIDADADLRPELEKLARRCAELEERCRALEGRPARDAGAPTGTPPEFLSLPTDTPAPADPAPGFTLEFADAGGPRRDHAGLAEEAFADLPLASAGPAGSVEADVKLARLVAELCDDLSDAADGERLVESVMSLPAAHRQALAGRARELLDDGDADADRVAWALDCLARHWNGPDAQPAVVAADAELATRFARLDSDVRDAFTAALTAALRLPAEQKRAAAAMVAEMQDDGEDDQRIVRAVWALGRAAR